MINNYIFEKFLFLLKQKEYIIYVEEINKSVKFELTYTDLTSIIEELYTLDFTLQVFIYENKIPFKCAAAYLYDKEKSHVTLLSDINSELVSLYKEVEFLDTIGYFINGTE